MKKRKVLLITLILTFLLLCLLTPFITHNIGKKQQEDIYCIKLKEGMMVSEVKQIMQDNGVEIWSEGSFHDYTYLYTGYDDSPAEVLLFRRYGVKLIFYKGKYQGASVTTSISESGDFCPSK